MTAFVERERVTTAVPLGVRFWDVAADAAATGPLRVVATETTARGPGRSVPAVPTPSGAYAFPGLGGPGVVIGPATVATRACRIDVTDSRGLGRPARAADGPAPVAARASGLRGQHAGRGRRRGDRAEPVPPVVPDARAGPPPPGGRWWWPTWRRHRAPRPGGRWSWCGRRRRARHTEWRAPTGGSLVVLPWPEPATAGLGSPVMGTPLPLHQQSWAITVVVHSDPAVAADPQPPDLCAVLAQRVAHAVPDDPVLRYGRTTALRSAGRSTLGLTPAP